MIMIVISFALVKFYAFAILYVLIVMQIKLFIIHVILSGVLIGRETITSLQITAYE